MRIPNPFLKSVGFIAEVFEDANKVESLDMQATGFFVTVPSHAVPNASYHLFVTAKHVALDLAGKTIDAVVNNKAGAVTSLPIVGDHWYLHPSDTTADVAVIPFNITPELDIVAVPVSRFISAEDFGPKRIGIGDEVFTIGLFSYAPGTKRNMPIVRHGNIAMIPEEHIQVDGSFVDAYLVEARSIGGMSGSPVFVRKTATVKWSDESGSNKVLYGASGDYSLLGVMHGHWDVKESEINKPHAAHDRQRGVNMGFGVVVPAYKILETVNQRDLVTQREEREALIRLQT